MCLPGIVLYCIVTHQLFSQIPNLITCNLAIMYLSKTVIFSFTKSSITKTKTKTIECKITRTTLIAPTFTFLFRETFYLVSGELTTGCENLFDSEFFPESNCFLRKLGLNALASVNGSFGSVPACLGIWTRKMLKYRRTWRSAVSLRLYCFAMATAL